MVYVVIENDDGSVDYFKFATLMTAAYYLKGNNKTNYTISDSPMIEVDDDGNEIEMPETSYRMI